MKVVADDHFVVLTFLAAGFDDAPLTGVVGQNRAATVLNANRHPARDAKAAAQALRDRVELSEDGRKLNYIGASGGFYG
jgi:hypothetical protein